MREAVGHVTGETWFVPLGLEGEDNRALVSNIGTLIGLVALVGNRSGD